MFDGLKPHVIDSKSLIEAPHFEDGVFIEGCILDTLDDGMHVELCLWSADGMSFWDVSIDKAEFAASVRTDFLRYLSEKGLPLTDINDRFGKWKYCGIIDKEKVLRIQYAEVDE